MWAIQPIAQKETTHEDVNQPSSVLAYMVKVTALTAAVHMKQLAMSAED
jgi:hypothetical protein